MDHELDLFEHRRNRLVNTVHTWLLAAGSLLILAVCAWAFAGWVGVAYAVVFGTVSMWLVNHVSPAMVLSMYKARPVSRAEFPEGVAIVEELARRAGLPSPPVLHVVPSQMMNAFAVGRRDDSAIAITDGLVRRLTLREFAGVLAHEMSHIAHEDVKVMAFADMVSRYTSLMSTVGLFSLFLNLLGFAGGYEAQVPWVAVIVLMAAPTIGGLLQMALSRTREYDADLGAAMLTGDPDGLASALLKLERAQRRLWEGLVLPGGRIPDPSMLRTHPPTDERVRRLMALKAARGLPAPPTALGLAPRPRRSFIPAVRTRRPTQDDYLRLAPLMAADHPVPAERRDRPASADELRRAEGRPRIHVRRGGVWW